MANSQWRKVRGILMTSEPITAYGGLSIPGDVLRDLARQLDGSGIPFHVDHDMTRPLRIREFRVEVNTRADGIDELGFSAELHDDDMHWLESRPGLSATMTTPLERDALNERNEDATIRLSADHAWFADEALVDAEQQLITAGFRTTDLRVERAFQFSSVPDPQIYLEIASTLLLSVGASAIWDGIKSLFRGRRTPEDGDAAVPTVVNVSIEAGSRSLRAVVSTSDELAARRAFESLDQAVTSFLEVSSSFDTPIDATTVTIWDDEKRSWAPPM